jgi:hypothetical protein
LRGDHDQACDSGQSHRSTDQVTDTIKSFSLIHVGNSWSMRHIDLRQPINILTSAHPIIGKFEGSIRYTNGTNKFTQ